MSQIAAWAVPVDVRAARRFLDHTFVVADDHLYFSCFGRVSAETKIDARRISDKIGSSQRAICFSQVGGRAGLRYGLTGVCHQAANRILFAQYDPSLVDGAKGYGLSHLLFGHYGRGFRMTACELLDGDIQLHGSGPVIIGPPHPGGGDQYESVPPSEPTTMKEDMDEDMSMVRAVKSKIVDLHRSPEHRLAQPFKGQLELELEEFRCVLGATLDSKSVISTQTAERLLEKREEYMLNREALIQQFDERRIGTTSGFLKKFYPLADRWLQLCNRSLRVSWRRVAGNIEPISAGIIDEAMFADEYRR